MKRGQLRLVQIQEHFRAAWASNPDIFCSSKRLSVCRAIKATVAKIQPNGCQDTLNLQVASCGDSRALLWRKSSDTILCTRDHRPGDKSERDRIKAAGGEVVDDFSGPRIDGKLACSRALGDFGFKQGPGSPAEQKVTCMPEVYSWPAQRGDWLILGCDGIWDTLSNEQVVQHVCSASKDVGDTVAGILHLCIDKEADDNLTLIAVELGSIPFAEPSTTVSAGDFLKAKDPAVSASQSCKLRQTSRQASHSHQFALVLTALHEVGTAARQRWKAPHTGARKAHSCRMRHELWMLIGHAQYIDSSHV